MPVGIQYNEQFKAFADFAADRVAAGKSKAVARAECDYNPFSTRVVLAAENDGPGGFAALFRSGASKRANNVARDIFRESVNEVFGGESLVPESVKEAMKLGDYGAGRPLTARRVLAVKDAVDRAIASGAQAFEEAKAKAVNAYRLAGEEGKAALDARLADAIRQCAGDPDAIAILVQNADRILTSGNVALRSTEDILARVDRLKANLAELREAARGDAAVLDAGRTFLRSLDGKGVPDGLLARLVGAARAADVGALKALGGGSGPVDIHKAVVQFRENLEDMMVSSGAETALEGAEQKTPCRDFLKAMMLAKCGAGALRSMQKALLSQNAAGLIDIYDGIRRGRFVQDGVSDGLLDAAAQESTALSNDLDRLVAAVNGTLLDREAGGIPPLGNPVDHGRAKTSRIFASMLEIGRKAIDRNTEAFLARTVAGSGPGADKLRAVLRRKVGADCYSPDNLVRDAESRVAKNMLNWNILSDMRKFATGAGEKTMFAKDIVRAMKVTLPGGRRLPNDFDAARDLLGRFVSGRQDASWATLSEAEQRKTEILMSILSQETEKAAFEGSALALDPNELRPAAQQVGGDARRYDRSFELDLSPTGDITVKYTSVKTGMAYLLTEGESTDIPESAVFRGDLLIRIPPEELDRLSALDFSAFDPVAAQSAHDNPPERDRLGHVVDSFAPGFRLAPGFDVTANFSAVFPA